MSVPPHSPPPEPARFSAVSAADWNQDGPSWGLACRGDGRPFRFVLVALDGATLDWRMYALVPVSPHDFERGVRICGALWKGSVAAEEPLAADVQAWLGAAGRSDLTGAEALVLTPLLDGDGGTMVNVPDPVPDRYGALVQPALRLQARMADGQRLILPRARFVELVELCFGPMELPDLDQVESSGPVTIPNR
jgi:hypothetical protein